MRWIAPIATRVADAAIDRILRNHDERIRQLVKRSDAVSDDAVTDHSALEGLGDDDHEQYLLVDGSRAMTGDLYHGDRKLVLSAGSGVWMDSAGAYIAGEVSAGSDWNGRFKATGVGDISAIPLPLLVGDRIKKVDFRYYGASTDTKRFSLIRVSTASSTPAVLQTDTTALSGFQVYEMTIASPYTMGEVSPVWAQFRSGLALDRFYQVVVTYDRPKT